MTAPGRVLVVANPISGSGRNRKAAPRLVASLGRRGIAAEVAFTERRGHGQELAAAAPGRGFDAVVAVGGDGTLREVAEGLGERLPAAIYPTGTANVLAREIGIPFDPDGAAAVVAGGAVARIDTARVGGRHAIFVVGVGFDAEIVASLERVRCGAISYASYLRPIASTLAHYRPPRLRVSVDGSPPFSCGFAIVSNSRCYAGPWVRFGAGPSLIDGRFEIYRFEVSGLPSLVAAGLRGLFGALPGGRVSRVSGSRIRIESDEPAAVQIDGDAAGMTPVEIEVLPRSLPILVPPASPLLAEERVAAQTGATP